MSRPKCIAMVKAALAAAGVVANGITYNSVRRVFPTLGNCHNIDGTDAQSLSNWQAASTGAHAPKTRGADPISYGASVRARDAAQGWDGEEGAPGILHEGVCGQHAQ